MSFIYRIFSSKRSTSQNSPEDKEPVNDHHSGICQIDDVFICS